MTPQKIVVFLFVKTQTLNDINAVCISALRPPIEARREVMPQSTVNYVDHTMNQLQQVYY